MAMTSNHSVSSSICAIVDLDHSQSFTFFIPFLKYDPNQDLKVLLFWSTHKQTTCSRYDI